VEAALALESATQNQVGLAGFKIGADVDFTGHTFNWMKSTFGVDLKTTRVGLFDLDLPGLSSAHIKALGEQSSLPGFNDIDYDWRTENIEPVFAFGFDHTALSFPTWFPVQSVPGHTCKIFNAITEGPEIATSVVCTVKVTIPTVGEVGPDLSTSVEWSSKDATALSLAGKTRQCINNMFGVEGLDICNLAVAFSAKNGQPGPASIRGKLLLDKGALKPLKSVLAAYMNVALNASADKVTIGSTTKMTMPKEYPVGGGELMTDMSIAFKPVPTLSVAGKVGVRFKDSSVPTTLWPKFNADFDYSPNTTDLTLRGELEGTWKDPFGCQGVSLSGAKLEMGVNLITLATTDAVAALSRLHVEGILDLGVAPNIVKCRVTLKFVPSLPLDVVFVGSFSSDLSMERVLEIAAGAAAASGSPVTADQIPKFDFPLNFKSPAVSLATSLVQIGNTTYDKGLTISATTSLLGVDNVRAYFTIGTSNVKALFVMPKFFMGGMWFYSTKDGKEGGPLATFEAQLGTNPTISLDVRADVQGLVGNGKAVVTLTNKKIYVKAAMTKLLGLELGASLEMTGLMDENAKPHAFVAKFALSQNIVNQLIGVLNAALQRLADEATKKFDEADQALVAAAKTVSEKKSKVEDFRNRLSEHQREVTGLTNKVNELRQKVEKICTIRDCPRLCVPGCSWSGCASQVCIGCPRCHRSGWGWACHWDHCCHRACVAGWTGCSSCHSTAPDLVCEAGNLACKATKGAINLVLDAEKIAQAVAIAALELVKKASYVADLALDVATKAMHAARVALDVVKGAVKGALMVAQIIVKYALGSFQIKKITFGLDMNTTPDLAHFEVEVEFEILHHFYPKLPMKIDLTKLSLPGKHYVNGKEIDVDPSMTKEEVNKAGAEMAHGLLEWVKSNVGSVSNWMTIAMPNPVATQEVGADKGEFPMLYLEAANTAESGLGGCDDTQIALGSPSCAKFAALRQLAMSDSARDTDADTDVPTVSGSVAEAARKLVETGADPEAAHEAIAKLMVTPDDAKSAILGAKQGSKNAADNAYKAVDADIEAALTEIRETLTPEDREKFDKEWKSKGKEHTANVKAAVNALTSSVSTSGLGPDVAADTLMLFLRESGDTIQGLPTSDDIMIRIARAKLRQAEAEQVTANKTIVESLNATHAVVQAIKVAQLRLQGEADKKNLTKAEVDALEAESEKSYKSTKEAVTAVSAQAIPEGTQLMAAIYDAASSMNPSELTGPVDETLPRLLARVQSQGRVVMSIEGSDDVNNHAELASEMIEGLNLHGKVMRPSELLSAITTYHVGELEAVEEDSDL